MLKKYEMLHKNMTLMPDTIFARGTQWQTWLDVEAALARVPVSYTHLTLPTT